MLPNPILSFSLFGKNFQVYMYGLCIAVGLLACFIVLFTYTKKRKMPYEVLEFIFFTAIFAIAIGFLFAKLYQAIYNWIEDGSFDFMNAGITVMGGLIGGAATFLLIYFGIGHYVFNKGKKKNLHIKHFNTIFSVAPICITVAHAFGRIGCLMAGCCYGREVDSGFRIYNAGAYRIPAQLYEAIFLFAHFAILSVLYFKRYNFIMHLYLVAYAIWRFIIEIFRDDPRGATVLGLEPSQWQSIVFIAIGIILTVFYYIRKLPFRLPETTNEEE